MNRREAIKRSALISGFAVSGSMMSALLQGCGGEVSTAPDWTPEFFTPEEGEKIGALAEAIIPRTDTPGAKDVFVDRYIDMIVNNCMSESDQQRFKRGVSELYDAYEESGGKAFMDATAEEQLAYLQQAEMDARQIAADAGNIREPDTDADNLDARPFLPDFKNMVIAGYFTSEQVGKEVLAYDPIPGEWIPCGDLQELTGGKLWSL